MRRGSIKLPSAIDRDANKAGTGGDENTMNMMQDTKNRADNNMARLSVLLQRTSDVDESPKMVRRKASKLRKHPSVPDFIQLAGNERSGSKETAGTKASRRSSFRDEASLEQAKHFRAISNRNTDGGELSRWLNAEMITRRNDEGKVDGRNLTVRQLLKVDDRIGNYMELQGNRYRRHKTLE